MRHTLIQLAREPLVHFCFIGLGIFLLYDNFAPQEHVNSERTITITAGEIDWLANSWEKRWSRPPTAQELDGLVQDYTRELVLYREALAMGLDKEDTVVRRRLAQKLEFLSKDLVHPAEPSPQELRDWFAAHSEHYTDPDLYTLSHIFLNPDKRGEHTLQDAEAIRGRLSSRKEVPANIEEFGDSFMLPHYFSDRSERDLKKVFGAEFSSRVVNLELGKWSGPIRSGYGIHVVYLHHYKAAPQQTFELIKDRVRKDWMEAKREELNEQFIKGLLSRYDIIIENSTAPTLSEEMARAGS